jgi:hypothetical protein
MEGRPPPQPPPQTPPKWWCLCTKCWLTYSDVPIKDVKGVVERTAQRHCKAHGAGVFVALQRPDRSKRLRSVDADGTRGSSGARLPVDAGNERLADRLANGQLVLGVCGRGEGLTTRPPAPSQFARACSSHWPLYPQVSCARMKTVIGVAGW